MVDKRGEVVSFLSMQRALISKFLRVPKRSRNGCFHYLSHADITLMHGGTEIWPINPASSN